jgi:hypothetical protein
VTPKPIIKVSWPEVLADDRSPLVRPHAAHGTALGNNWPLAFCQAWCWQGRLSVLLARLSGLLLAALVAGCWER